MQLRTICRYVRYVIVLESCTVISINTYKLFIIPVSKFIILLQQIESLYYSNPAQYDAFVFKILESKSTSNRNC